MPAPDQPRPEAPNPGPNPGPGPGPTPARPGWPDSWPGRWRQRMGQIPPARLFGLGLIAAAVWLFLQLAEEMAEGETAALDQALLMALRAPGDPARPFGPPWLETVMRDITALGGFTVLGLLTLGLAGLMWAMARRRTALLILGAVAGGQVFSNLSKAFFDRPRPDLVPHGTLVTSSSFPSGHAMMAAVVWLTLAALLVRIIDQRAARIWVLSLAGAITIAVGISRVYLGVHWPSDVLAGWTAGLAWALICAGFAGWADRR